MRLNCIGTMKDLARCQIRLQDGSTVTLYSEELEVEGEAQYSKEENIWVAAIDWDAIAEIELEPISDRSFFQMMAGNL